MPPFPCSLVGPVWVTRRALVSGIVRYERVLQVSPCDVEIPAFLGDTSAAFAVGLRAHPVRIRVGWHLAYTEALAEVRRMAEARQAEISPRLDELRGLIDLPESHEHGESGDAASSVARAKAIAKAIGQRDALHAEWRALTKMIQNTVVVRDGITGEVIPCA